MPTVDELNAAFVVAKSSLTKLANTLLPNDDIPFVGNLRTIGVTKLQSPEARPYILEEVKEILAAAEAVRTKAAAGNVTALRPKT